MGVIKLHPISKGLIIVLFSISIVLSAYHLLVIGGVIKDFCAVPAKVHTIDDFMHLLEDSVPCSKAEWKFLGIPIAGYNLVASCIFMFLFLKAFITDRSLAPAAPVK